MFGLPGNPVSVSVTFNLFARTALLAMQGASEPALKQETAALARRVKGNVDRESYLPAQLTTTSASRVPFDVWTPRTRPSLVSTPMTLVFPSKRAPPVLAESAMAGRSTS